MAYHKDSFDNSIVIDGFENGIADSPYAGISDMRNVNIVSVPGEASVNFKTVTQTEANNSGTLTNTVMANNSITFTGGSIAQGQAVTFAGAGLAGTGIVAGTVYWVVDVGGGVYKICIDYGLTTILNITANSGTGTFTTVNMGQPKYFTNLKTPFADNYFMVDSLGQVWSDLASGTGNWRFTGNTTTGGTGNGLVAYVPSDTGSTAKGYIFVFRNFQIDFATITSNTTLAWTYGWKPSTGATGQSNYLQCYNTGSNVFSHESIVAPDNKVYYCDSNWIGRFYQASPTVGFDPLTTSTYVFDVTAVLPFTDRAQCLAPLGNNLLIGGKNNVIYPWDTFSPLALYPIMIAESNIVKMVTVNTNTFIFAGNRGRIYITNSAQAQLFKKIPDHLSGTVEPYFTWGGATSNKNQLYFSASCTTNAGVSITAYGGVWAIDLDTKAIRLVNKLSYNTYAGYATALIPNFSSSPAGTGLYIGWDSGASTYGIDQTTSNVYTSSEAYIDSDLIPIGTFNKKINFEGVEFRLSKPLVSGESVSIYYRLDFSQSYTLIKTFNTVGIFSGWNAVNFKNAQWIQLRAVLNSTNSTPSYTRMREFRITRPNG